VDLLEQNPLFLAKAKDNLTGISVGHFLSAPLQDFEFKEKYDVIWIQWVLLYLLDVRIWAYLHATLSLFAPFANQPAALPNQVDLIAFFKRCKAALNPHGIIIVKENVTKEGYFIDAHDNSITRSPTHFKTIFAQAGMRLLKEDVVTDFPPELFPVRMYALL
jgi:protein N-terminal methyltransferase